VQKHQFLIDIAVICLNINQQACYSNSNTIVSFYLST